MFLFEYDETNVLVGAVPILNDVFARFTTTASITTGTTVTCDISPVVKDGDLVFAWFDSNNTSSWSVPSGWTQTVTPYQTAWAGTPHSYSLMHKVWRTGGALTVGSVVTIPSGSIAAIAMTYVVRCGSDGANILIGNPPSAGFTTGYEADQSTAGSTVTIPRLRVDSSVNDLRLVFSGAQSRSGTGATPGAVTASANNPYSLRNRLMQFGTGGTNGVIAIGQWADPSGTEAGTTTWTYSNSTRTYTVGVVLSDPDSTGFPCVDEIPVYSADTLFGAVGLEEISILSSQGGGGGVSVW